MLKVTTQEKTIKKAKAPGGIVEMRQKIDWKRRNEWLASGTKGDCVTQSMRLYIKLKGAGGVRVRGTRLSDRTICPVNTPPHYWVENKGYVFESFSGVSQIIEKSQFYKGWLVQDVEYAEYGMLFADEIPTGYGDHCKKFSTKQLEWMVTVYEAKEKDYFD